MNAFRLSGVVVGVALLAGSGSIAKGQFVAMPAGASMHVPLCGGCTIPANLNHVNLSVPTLSSPTLHTSFSVPTIVVPPPTPPPVTVRAYPVVVDDRDRDRNYRHEETPVQVDVSSTATPSSYSDSGYTSTPAEMRTFDAPQIVDQPSSVATPAPWYSIGHWSFGTWAVILFVGLFSLSSGKR